MTSRYDLVPRHPGAPSLVVTVDRPPYRAPERPVPPVYRPFALGAGAGAGRRAGRQLRVSIVNLGRLWDRYRIPLLVGIGGLSALFTINARREAQQAAAAAASAAATPAVVPGDTAGAFQQGLGAGAALYGQAVGQGLAPTEQALGLAGTVVQSAAAFGSAVSGDYLGFGSSLVGALAGLVQPVTQPPAPGGGPAQPPTVPAADAFVGYYAVTRPGSGLLFTVDQGGRITNQRTYAFAGGRAPVRRSTSSTLHWRYEGGPVNGWSLIPGRSPSFEIQKRWRRADGTFYFTTISNTGS